MSDKNLIEMISLEKQGILEGLIGGMGREELLWLSGYVSGRLSASGAVPVATAAVLPPAARALKLTILYGTETGNAKKLAQGFAVQAKARGLQAKAAGMEQYRSADLSKEEQLLVVLSTHGEGEPPAAAKKFYDHLHQSAPALPRLHYSVLALGDTAYPLFCKAGEDVDVQLEKLGARRLTALQKCDVDYQSDADQWFTRVLAALDGAAVAAPAAVSAGLTPAKKPSGKKIYQGHILANINLNDRGSKKETHHIEITTLEGTPIDYQPGDALGVIPENPAGVVEVCLGLSGVDRERRVRFRGEELPVQELLKTRLNINFLPERVVKKYAALVGADIPLRRMALSELLQFYPLQSSNGQFDQLLEILEPLAPRLYSISSSPEAHEGEVHVTVARDLFLINEEIQCGLCSDYLSHLLPQAPVEFYIHKNNQFRLPADDSRDVIMIGPGTGIAPFRSFLAHREAVGATGRNWLFFGEQHFVSDFLYQSELQNWLSAGVLTRLSVAFSRDQPEKVYVQHKMLRHGEELYEWIRGGASLYVCGAKEPMSVDVEDTLLQIMERQGGHSIEEAVAFVEQLKEEGRYVKDVY